MTQKLPTTYDDVMEELQKIEKEKKNKKIMIEKPKLKEEDEKPKKNVELKPVIFWSLISLLIILFLATGFFGYGVVSDRFGTDLNSTNICNQTVYTAPCPMCPSIPTCPSCDCGITNITINIPQNLSNG